MVNLILQAGLQQAGQTEVPFRASVRNNQTIPELGPFPAADLGQGEGRSGSDVPRLQPEEAVHPRLGADGPCPDAGMMVGETPFS